jgi:tRNA U34 5-carboxymethylaminomethyl modifying GTPase MnmE/TrmE
MPVWIDNFNLTFNANPRVDVCLIVIEKKERVDNNTVLAF